MIALRKKNIIINEKSLLNRNPFMWIYLNW